MIQPEAIPQFTGNLPELEKDQANLKTDAGNIRTTGADVHSHFQGLSAYYHAPEAEQLFASTKPVQDRADGFADSLEKVSTALSEYATEVRPLVAKLTQLKHDATTFVNANKDDGDWDYDEDKVNQNNKFRDDVTATVAAFWAAERTCHNKITTLFGGTQMVAGDGMDRKDQYGYNADDLKNAKLPWGDPVDERHHWYEVGHWVKSFVWDGLIVDGVWGTIKGLGTLVGFGGWDAMGQAWKGLAQLATGLTIMSIPGAGTMFWALPDDKLPSWLRDSRTAMKETGKALVAWDEWGKNPGRAAGAVTFNVLTTVFTGGAGGAASGAGKAGAIAKALSVAGKVGKVIDPMTYVAKGAGLGLSKIGDIAKGLKGIGNIEIPKFPDNAIKLPEGSFKLPDGTIHLPEGAAIPDGAVKLPNGTVKLPDHVLALPEDATKLPTNPGEPARYYDSHGNILDHEGNVLDRADNAPKEGSPTVHPTPAKVDNIPARVETTVKEPVLVGAGTRTVGDAGHVIRVGDSIGNDLGDIGRTGDNIPGGHIGDNLPGGNAGSHLPGSGLGDHLPTGRVGDHLPAAHLGDTAVTPGSHVPGAGDNLPGAGRADDLGTGPSAGRDLPGGSTSDGLPGGGSHPEVPHGTGELDDLGRVGDDAGGFGDDAGRAGDDASGPHGDDGSGNGHNGQEPAHPLSEAQRQEIISKQVDKANTDEAWRSHYYEPDGTRRSVFAKDENGHNLPKLRQRETGEWYDPNGRAAADPEKYKPIAPVDGIRDTVRPEHIDWLDDSAAHRRASMAVGDAERAFKKDPSVHNAEALQDARDAFGSDDKYNTRASEVYGEDVTKYHAVPDNFPNAKDVTPPGTGNRRFDHVYENGDRHLLVESKAPNGTLKDREGVGAADGLRVQQGTREYILATIHDMLKRTGETDLAAVLSDQLTAGKLDYVVVKSTENTGHHIGYQMKHFDIS